MNGKQYDQLILRTDCNGPNHTSAIRFFPGKREGENTWTFTFPDTILNTVYNFGLLTKPFDLKTSTLYIAKFKGLIGNDLMHYNYIFDENNPILEATFVETIERPKPKGEGNYFNVNDTTFLDGIARHEDLFKVNFKQKDTELELNMRYPRFFSLDTEHYESAIAEKLAIIKKYPDSKFLMSQFFYCYQDFKTISDANKIFSAFSEKNRTTGYGPEIGGYIKLYSSKFVNKSLTNTATGKIEPIIIDSTKYNLLIFSASWCAPCHKLIPLLKEIYHELNPKLEMVYISIDENKYVEAWKKLMIGQNIPWRSLMSLDHVKDVVNQYDAGSIPNMLLVYPNKTVKKIDIRVKEDKDLLYKLVLGNSRMK